MDYRSDTSNPTDTVEFSGTPCAEFHLLTEDCVKVVFQKKRSCNIDLVPVLILYGCVDELCPR